MNRKSTVWQDLVEDYLEVSADLKSAERSFLIDHLKRDNVKASSISAYPTFQIAEKLIVICKEPYQECWFYHPRGRQRNGANRLRCSTLEKIQRPKTAV